MALDGRWTLGKANAPPSTGWQLTPGRLFTISENLFKLWATEFLMFSTSCRRQYKAAEDALQKKNPKNPDALRGVSQVSPCDKGGMRDLLVVEDSPLNPEQSDPTLVRRSLLRTVCRCMSWLLGLYLPVLHSQHADHTWWKRKKSPFNPPAALKHHFCYFDCSEVFDCKAFNLPLHQSI